MMKKMEITFVCCLSLFLVSSSLAEKTFILGGGDLISGYRKEKTNTLNFFNVTLAGDVSLTNKMGTEVTDAIQTIEENQPMSAGTIERQNYVRQGGPPAPPNPPVPPNPPAPACLACVWVPLMITAIAVGIAVPLARIHQETIVPSFNVLSPPRRIPMVMPTNLTDLPNDGCNKTDVLFDDGLCYPLLRPCRNPLYWTTVDPLTLRGKCRPRLCGRQRVFIGQDELCHDIEDPVGCSGGKRLYYSAYGDPVCDCPIGQYPFRTERSDQLTCVGLFTQGPCPAGQVFSILETGAFGCAPAQCQVSAQPPNSVLQFVPGGDGFCYPLGTRGSCPGESDLLGYDVFQRKVVCVDMNDPRSPYFESAELNDLLDKTYNQRSPTEFIGADFDITLISISDNSLRRNDSETRRQGQQLTLGIFQIPTFSPTTLLNPCRPSDSNRGDNYKCANPIVPNLRGRLLLQAVRAAFTCGVNAVLQAKGFCGRSRDEANCGPTYSLSSSTSGVCEKSIL